MAGVGTLGVGAITTSGALTYGGVTLSNSVTGTGSMVLSTSPTLVTPALGTPSALVGTNITGTAAGLTAGNVTTNANLTGAVTSVGNATSLGSFSSANLAGALTDETGTGSAVFATSPTLVTPALGTPASGVVTNLTGTASININGTVGATTASTGAFTTLSASGDVTLSGGTANGVAFLNGSKVLTTGSALTFDGTNFATTGSATGTQLIVSGPQLTDGQIRLSNTTTRASGNKYGIRFADSTFETNASIYAEQNSSGNNVAALVFGVNAGTGGAGLTSAPEGMRLTSTGLGIGTSSPAYKLDVRGVSASVQTRAAALNSFLGEPITGGVGVVNDTNSLVLKVANTAGGNTAGVSIAALLEASASNKTAMVFSADDSSGTLVARMRLDSSGNLGLGVTPSAWGSGFRGVDLGGNSALYDFTDGTNVQSNLYCNGYVNSSSQEIYKTSATASAYRQIQGSHRWYTAPSGTAGDAISFTQAMSLTAAGTLLVGKTSSDGGVVGVEARADGSIWSAVSASTDAVSTLNTYSTGAGAFRFYVGMGGTVYATSTTITAISDQRLKENIRDLDDGLATVMALKPRKFDWKAGKGKDIKGDRGWIAQEFEQVFPDMIEEWKDPAPEGEEPYKAVNANLIPTLVKAIQELKAEFDAYKVAHP
jgi:hypothetical protein